jgi:hypothetical protein
MRHTLPRSSPLPIELIDQIIHCAQDDHDSLHSWSYVHSSWICTIRKLLFHRIEIKSGGSWERLHAVLSATPSIIPYIHKFVVNESEHCFLSTVAILDKRSHNSATLGSILNNIVSLELVNVDLHRAGDAVLKYFRGHFLNVKHLRLTAVAAPTPSVIQEVFLTPRAMVDSIYLSNVTVSDPLGGLALRLMDYTFLEVDRYTLSIPTDLHHNWMFHEEGLTRPISSIRSLRVHGIQGRNFAFMAHALQLIGPSLTTLDQGVQGCPNRTYHGESSRYTFMFPRIASSYANAS